MGKKTNFEDVKRIVEKENDKLISNECDYKTNKSLLKIECKCGKASFYRSLASIKQHSAYHCEICRNKRMSNHKKKTSNKVYKYTYDEVVKYVESKDCKFLSSSYNKASDLYHFQCQCGNIFERRFSKFKDSNQTKCKQCSKRSMKNILSLNYEDIKNFILSKGCELLSKEYVNNETKLMIKCKCGEVFYRDYSHFKDSKSYYCDVCTHGLSKGELIINEILERSYVDFIRQYTFDNCRTTRPLPFDFYLPTYNCCIEFDGKQHYETGKFGKTLVDLMNIKYRDNIKTNFCKNNNIKLIRIPYWEFNNIESILRKELGI